jgi:hypothetical protein
MSILNVFIYKLFYEKKLKNAIVVQMYEIVKSKYIFDPIT